MRRVALVALLVALALAGWLLVRGPAARVRAALHFARAEKLVREQKADLARDEFRRALELQPGHREALRDLAGLELSLGLVEHAFLQLQAWAEMHPEDADAFLGLARLRLTAGQLEEAEAAASLALEIAPDDAASRELRAQIRYRAGRYHGALLDAQRAVERNPRSIAGALRDLLRKPPAAADALQRPPAPRLDSAENWPGALGTLIRAFVDHSRRAEWTSAQGQAREARTTYPSTMLGPWLEGLSALGQGKLELAEEQFLEALRLAPRSHRVITSLAGLWSRQHGPAESGNRLVRIAERDEGFDYPLSTAARAYLEAGQPALAEATVRRELQRRKNSPAPFSDLAQLFLDLDRPSDALAVCDDGLARFPDDARLQLERGHGSALLGDREAAIQSYQRVLLLRPDDDRTAAELLRLLVAARTDAESRRRALQLVRDLELDAPSDPGVLDAIGTAQLQLASNAARARALFEAAAKLAPDQPGIRYHLATAWLKLGDAAAARREVRAALEPGRPFDQEPEARQLLRELGDTAR